VVVGCGGGVEELIRGSFYFLCSKLDFSVFFPDDAWIDEGRYWRRKNQEH